MSLVGFVLHGIGCGEGGGGTIGGYALHIDEIVSVVCTEVISAV